MWGIFPEPELKPKLEQFSDSITDITARLVVNRVSMKVKSKEIKELIERLKKVRKK